MKKSIKNPRYTIYRKKEILKYISKKNHEFTEIVYNQPVRFYTDIEIYSELPQCYINKIKKKLIDVFKKFIEKPEFYFLDASRILKHENKYKASYHVTGNMYFKDQKTLKTFIFNEFDADDLIELDMSVYSQNNKISPFRTVLSTKYNNNDSLLKPIDKNIELNKYLITEISDCEFIKYEIKDEKLDNKNKYLGNVEKNIYDYKQHEDCKFIEENLTEIRKILKRDVNISKVSDYKIDDNVFVIISLSNKGGLYCPLCFRTHENDNFYLVYNKKDKSKINFHCRRNQKDGGNIKFNLKRNLGFVELLQAKLQQDALKINVSKLYDGFFKTKEGEEVIENNDLIVIKSMVDTGKSYFIKKYLEKKEDKSAISISFRQALVLKHQNDFGDSFTNYIQDKSFYNDRYIVCLNSLWRMNKNNYDFVILDEIDSIIKHLFSGTINNASRILTKLCKIIKNAKKVFVADADITNLSLEFLIILKSRYKFIMNTFIKNPKKIQIWKSKDALEIDLFKRIKEGKRVFVCGDSRREITRIYQECEKIKKEDNIKTIQKLYTRKIGKKSDLCNVNKFWKGCNIFVSPTVVNGISYENNDFDFVYSFCNSFTLDSYDIFQQINRVRNINHYVKAFINDYSYVSHFKSLDHIKRYVLNIDSDINDFSREYFEKNLDIYVDLKGDIKINTESLYNDLYCKYILMKEKLREEKKYEFIKICNVYKWKITYNNSSLNDKETIDLKLFKKISKKITEEFENNQDDELIEKAEKQIKNNKIIVEDKKQDSKNIDDVINEIKVDNMYDRLVSLGYVNEKNKELKEFKKKVAKNDLLFRVYLNVGILLNSSEETFKIDDYKISELKKDIYKVNLLKSILKNPSILDNHKRLYSSVFRIKINENYNISDLKMKMMKKIIYNRKTHLLVSKRIRENGTRKYVTELTKNFKYLIKICNKD